MEIFHEIQLPRSIYITLTRQVNMPRVKIQFTLATLVDEMWPFKTQLLMRFGNTETLIGWMISREENIKQTMETTIADKANVAHFYGIIQFPRTGLP